MGARGKGTPTLIQFDLECWMPIFVLVEGQLIGVISPEPLRQTVLIPAEDGQRVVFESSMPYFLWEAEGL